MELPRTDDAARQKAVFRRAAIAVGEIYEFEGIMLRICALLVLVVNQLSFANADSDEPVGGDVRESLRQIVLLEPDSGSFNQAADTRLFTGPADRYEIDPYDDPYETNPYDELSYPNLNDEADEWYYDNLIDPDDDDVYDDGHGYYYDGLYNDDWNFGYPYDREAVNDDYDSVNEGWEHDDYSDPYDFLDHPYRDYEYGWDYP